MLGFQKSRKGKNYVVIGVSSSGKSTFITDVLIPKTGIGSDRVVLGHDFDAFLAEENNPKGAIYHFNLLNGLVPGFENVVDVRNSALARLLDKISDVEVIVIGATPPLIKKRTILREAVEPNFSRNVKYPNSRFLSVYSSANFVELYVPLVEYLSERRIKFRCVESMVAGFQELKGDVELFTVLSDQASIEYSDDEIASAISGLSSDYQDISAITGRDENNVKHLNRKLTFDVIKPFFKGNSFLDVGCGQGYFCFQAEDMGFRRIVGYDIKADRHFASTVLAQVYDRNIDFVLGDILNISDKEKFDTIIILNVIHHLQNPLQVFQKLSQLAADVLIIEFVTPSDPKFLSTYVGEAPKNSEPFIGVSILSNQDQMFVFTDESLRRILTENSNYFKSIQFFDSPMQRGRRIAVLSKQ